MTELHPSMICADCGKQLQPKEAMVWLLRDDEPINLCFSCWMTIKDMELKPHWYDGKPVDHTSFGKDAVTITIELPEEPRTRQQRLEAGTPKCGVDFCDGCGDCLSCYGGDPCYRTDPPDAAHMWVVYDDQSDDGKEHVRWV